MGTDMRNLLDVIFVVFTLIIKFSYFLVVYFWLVWFFSDSLMGWNLVN